MDEYLYDKYMEKYKSETVKVDLEWLLERCILEYGYKQDAVISGKERMEGFLEGFENMELPKSDQLQEKFNEYIVGCEYSNEACWDNREREFIKRLAQYRRRGSLDKNLSQNLLDFAKGINNDSLRYIYELVQNADDCEYPKDIVGKDIKIEIIIHDDVTGFTIKYPEQGMTYSDILAITTLGQSNKIRKKQKKIIGEKGIGFKTIFSVCKSVDIHSGRYHFRLNHKNFEPEWLDNEPDQKGTKMILKFYDEIIEGERKSENKLKDTAMFRSIIKKYGITSEYSINCEKVFQNCPIMFTNKINAISIEHKGERLTIERDLEERTEKITYCFERDGNTIIKKDLLYDRFQKDVVFTYEEYCSHYKKIFANEAAFNESDVSMKTYPLILLAPQNMEVKKGNLFAYLPSFTNINAPISMQIPFELNKDRSCMYMEGLAGEEHLNVDYELREDMNQERTTLWNSRLFKEAFISEEGNKSLLELAYEELRKKKNIFWYVPEYKTNNHDFFKVPDTDTGIDYNNYIKKMNVYSVFGGKNVIFEEFKKIKLLKGLQMQDTKECYVSIEEGTLLFKEEILSFFKEQLEEIVKILVDDTVEPVDKDSAKGRNIISYVNLEDYTNAVALGLKYATIKEKEEFVNRLITWNREKVIKDWDSLFENGVLTSVDKKKLHIIAMEGGKTLPLEAGRLWIKTNDNSFGQELRFINMELEGNAEVYEKLWNSPECRDRIVHVTQEVGTWDAIWDKIYKKQGNNESINCTFNLFKEIMMFMAQKSDNSDWFEYTKELIEDDENKDHMRENLITLWQNEDFLENMWSDKNRGDV